MLVNNFVHILSYKSKCIGLFISLNDMQLQTDVDLRSPLDVINADYVLM